MIMTKKKSEIPNVRRLTTNRFRFLSICLVAIYVAELIFVYSFFISVDFSGFGYINLSPTPIKIFIGIVFALIPSFLLPVTLIKPSHFVFWGFYLLIYIPTLVVGVFITNNAEFKNLLVYVFFLIMSFLIFFFQDHLKGVRIKRVNFNIYLFSLALLAGIISLAAWFISVHGLPTSLPAILEVYDLREPYKDILREQNTLQRMVPGLIQYVAAPFLIVTGILRRRWTYLIIGIGLSLLIYGIAGFKSALFVGCIAGILPFYSKKLANGISSSMLIGSLGIGIALLLMVSAIFEDNLLINLVIRRGILTPGLLSIYYHDFFSSNAFGFMANNRFFGLIPRLLGANYPYSLSIPNQIGLVYFDNSLMSANANVWADAFANFGYWGILAFSVVLCIVLRLYDKIAVQTGLILPLSLLIGPTIALVNTGLFVSLISHGMIASLILLYLTPKRFLDQP